jgi:hypothetical protein
MCLHTITITKSEADDGKKIFFQRRSLARLFCVSEIDLDTG